MVIVSVSGCSSFIVRVHFPLAVIAAKYPIEESHVSAHVLATSVMITSVVIEQLSFKRFFTQEDHKHELLRGRKLGWVF